MNEKKRVAIYIRVSTREQAREGYSLEAQEKVLREYCSQRGHEVTKIYRDEGISAKDIKHRPQMIQLLEDVEREIFDIVLVWKLTRFTRSLRDLCSMCDLLDEHKITLVSYSEAFDCSTVMGRTMRNMLGVFAQWEREVISENTKLGMQERAAQGKRTCPYVLGYDKTEDGFTVNQREANIVRFIYREYIRTECMISVANLCAHYGYKGKKGGEIKAESVHLILTRMVYCGYNSHARMPYKGTHEPIISVEEYNLVQSIIAENRKRIGRKRKHPLVFIEDKA